MPTNTAANAATGNSGRRNRRRRRRGGNNAAARGAAPAQAPAAADTHQGAANQAGTSTPSGSSQTNLHPNGEARIPIKDVRNVYDDDYEAIPLLAYKDAGVDIRRGWNSLVTPEDVERASDAWDARGTLHDIDTQWGMLPEGGAYKESNHYWGQGEYDFY